MIDYKNKYLKYKLKYLQLKRVIFTNLRSGPSLIAPNSPSNTSLGEIRINSDFIEALTSSIVP